MLLPLPLLLLPGLRQQTLHFRHPLCMQQPAGRHNLLRQLLQVVIPGQAKLDAAGSRHRVVDVTAVLSVAAAACRPAARPPPPAHRLTPCLVACTTSWPLGSTSSSRRCRRRRKQAVKRSPNGCSPQGTATNKPCLRLTS